MLKEQFRRDKFGLVHDDPKDFSVCCWQKSAEVKVGWVVYRTVLLGLLLSSFLYSIIFWVSDMSSIDKPKLLIYLTYWTFTLETFLFFWGFLVTVLDCANLLPEEEDGKLSLIVKVYWVVYTVVLPCALSVTVVFWSILNESQTKSSIVNNILIHAFNSVFIVLDFCLVGVPFRFLHFYMPYVYLTLYGTFSLIYELCGGTGSMGHEPIYPILDWKEHPLKTVVMTLLFCLLLFIVYIFFSFLYLLKLWLVRKYVLQER